MTYFIAIVAAAGAALFNGIAVVLEKVSADKKKQVEKLRISFLITLLNDWPYMIGIVLDIAAWILTLIAVHILPLFIVQPVIALSVIVAVAMDTLFRQKHLNRQLLYPIGIVLAGLVMLGLSASPQKAHVTSTVFKWIIILGPLGIGAAGAFMVRIDSKLSTFSLAGISGVAFGFTAVAGRLLSWGHPYWKIIDKPLLWALAAYGVLGLLILTVALQRQLASAVNAMVVAFETIVPIILGILFLGDSPRRGFWPLVGAGTALAIAGTVSISLRSNQF